MAVSIGPQIGVDGYSQYKAEIKNLIAQMDQYKAKADALSDSAEDLAKKEQYLKEQMRLQNEAMQKYAEYSEKAKARQQELESAEKKNTVQIENAKTAYINCQTAITQHGTELAKLEGELQQVQTAQQQETQSLKQMGDEAEKSNQKISASTIALGNLMSKAVEKGAELVKQAMEIGINYNASMETYRAAFETLLGDAEAAEKAVDNVRRLSKETPTFSTSSLTKSVQMLVAADKSAEEATKDIKALANAIAASGGGNSELERMAQNLQQIANAGKATSIDIRQFAYAGINVSQLLADYTGKSKEEVKDLTVTYDLLAGALRYAAEEGGRYYGGLEKQAQTYNGQLSALKKNAEELAGTFASSFTGIAEEDIFPAINEFLANDKTKSFVELLGKIGPAAGIAAVGLKGASVAATLLGVSFGAVAGPVGALAAVIAAATYVIEKFGETERKTKLGKGHSVEEYTENVKKYADEVERLQAEYDEMAAQGFDLAKITQELEKAEEQLTYAQDELTEATQGTTQAMEDAAAAESGAASSARYDAIITEARGKLDGLRDSYNEYYEAAEKAAQKQFKLFEEVDALEYTSTATLEKNLAAQTAYWEKYAENLAYVSDAQAGLSKELLEFLSDGSTESAGYLQSIVADIMAAGGASSKGGQEIINSLNQQFADLQNAQTNYADTTASTMTDFRNSMVKIVDDAKEELKKLDLTDEMYARGVSSIQGYANAMQNEMTGLQNQMYLWGNNLGQRFADGLNSVTITMPYIQGMNIKATGSIFAGSHAKGLDYVPRDDYLANLHKGEMVLTAAQANAVRSGEYQQSIANSAYNYGGVNINVYAAEGQSVDDIAEAVSYKLQNDVTRREGVYR